MNTPRQRFRKMRQSSCSLVLCAAVLACSSRFLFAAGVVDVTVRVDTPGARINPAMWGVFFEDINFGADGGLYAEMVKNRAFEFPEPMMGWFKISPSKAVGEVTVRDQDAFNPANPHYVRLDSEGTAPFGVSNTGFRGMGFEKGEAYDFSARIRGVEGSPRVVVNLYSSEGMLLDSTRFGGIDSNWKEIKATLRPNATDANSRLDVILEGKGTVDLDMVSLFPRKTWKNRPGGLRADMVQMLADMKPGFFRFPGGCIVEGSTLDRRYEWKNTIGPVEERPLLVNRWNYEFVHRPTPDYYQSFGLGFFEYFQLCEDIGAEPLPILNCGMACQFNSGELVPMNELAPYIQDALDLIEFANGPATSTWGAKRAAMGHPEPFHMKLLGVGNEQWGGQYIERYTAFAKALKSRHPEITLVSDSGPAPSDDRYEFLWPKLRELNADIVDEHCYANPVWFLTSAHRYDNFDRNGPKVFMGEYAAQSVGIVSPVNENNLECAIAEAAFLTGLERNADVVRMASYAPLFANEKAWQWKPDMIWVNNLQIYGTPNYYVQKLFSRNRGDAVLPVTLRDPAPSPEPAGRIGLGTYKTAAEFKDVRVTSKGSTLYQSSFSGEVKDWTSGGGEWSQDEGVLRQSDARATSTAYVGDTDWSDYTVSLKARKLDGEEGFQVVVCNEHDNTELRWNIGGWGNKSHGIQETLGGQPREIERVPGSIESGRWYDVRMELDGNHMKCFLDDTLIHDVEIQVPRRSGVFASAVYDQQTDDVIVKLVNADNSAREVNLQLKTDRSLKGDATATVLTSEHPSDVNSFEEPRRVAPRERILPGMKIESRQSLPPCSLTVLRVPIETK